MGTAISGLAAVIFLALMFGFGSSSLRATFGTLNDLFNAVLALAGVAVLWLLFTRFRSSLGPLHVALLALAVIGALVAVWGSVLVMSGRTGFMLAGFYTGAGFALIGLLMAALSFTPRGNALPAGLATFGIVTGLLMALGLAGVPGILRSIDAWDGLPMTLTTLWGIGWMATLLIQPVWFYLLAKWAFTKA